MRGWGTSRPAPVTEAVLPIQWELRLAISVKYAPMPLERPGSDAFFVLVITFEHEALYFPTGHPRGPGTALAVSDHVLQKRLGILDTGVLIPSGSNSANTPDDR